ncbi:permease of the drug/metabolite transporter (DMT) superfamily [Agrilactobacillus composti DSM 18527 = JCM 14202]|uniref:DMT family transporter n=1 Tax=Agrilactobacillus composti TaxID=398555 RepID=UPI00042DF966|nr:DMT family transporter [Agrilactobacillus composti]GAF40135.1 permease of the drug/metabolite transporter (DMT) superfamily [Agrilactobacillus composti DSM 18527 = JCM 14202]
MRKTFLFVLISTFLFSSMEITLKLAGSVFNPIQLNFIRFLIGGLVLLPLALRSMKANDLHIDRKAFASFALTGLLCVIVSMTLFQLAVVYGKASIVAVLFSSNPVFALLFSYLILHEKLSRSSLVSVIVSTIGLLVIINPFHLSNGVGMILAVLSAITFGFYSIISRKVSKNRHFNGVTMTCFTFILGSLELALLMGLSHLPIVAQLFGHSSLAKDFVAIPYFAGISASTILMILFIGIGVTGIGFATYFMAMERSDVSTASLVFFIKPALAPILALILISESIVANTWVGIVVILLGSAVSFFGQRADEQKSAMATTGYLQTVETEGEAADIIDAAHRKQILAQLAARRAALGQNLQNSKFQKQTHSTPY